MSMENAPEAHVPPTDGGRETQGTYSGWVDTLVDVGLAWAELGLGQGMLALKAGARMLENAAQSLDDLKQKLRKVE